VTAERLLARQERVDYVACGPLPSSDDQDWAERVRRHQERRPAQWNTMETLDLEAVLAGPMDSRLAGQIASVPELGEPVAGESATVGRARASLEVPVLVDCLSTWLAGVMEECGLWEGARDADKQLAERVDGLLDAWRGTRRHVVAVSNEVGSGVIPGTVSGVRFRDELGVLNARIAAECEQVWLCVAGIAQRLR
jgi:adenosylcobinamide kinase / adenosylcobinamide-phosphate guanylyltransferase